jgi:hypothetical protein
MQPQYGYLETREAFDQFIAEWESGKLPRTAWTHAAHVAVGACYSLRFGDGALSRMREGIIRYNESVGTPNTDTSGYHETLTRLWTQIIHVVIADVSDPLQAAIHAVEHLGERRDLHKLYYSFDVARSVKARKHWIPPDLQGPY